MYGPVSFSTFTMLGDDYTASFQNIASPQITPVPTEQLMPILPPPPVPAPVNVPSDLRSYLFWVFHVNGIIYTVTF